MAIWRERILLALFAPIAVAVFWSVVVYRPYWIPAGSMKPTLLIGDYLLVNRAIYGFPALTCGLGLCDGDTGPFGYAPVHGDVVVFKHPGGDFYNVKRVTGLPGDTVQMKQGILNLNGRALGQTPDGIFEETYILEHGYLACTNSPVEIGKICEKPRKIETLPDARAYHVLNILDDQPFDTTQEFVVPEGHVFVLGDNRDNSIDSRLPLEKGGMGMIPMENISGRVDIVVFSFVGEKGRLIRWVR